MGNTATDQMRKHSASIVHAFHRRPEVGPFQLDLHMSEAGIQLRQGESLRGGSGTREGDFRRPCDLEAQLEFLGDQVLDAFHFVLAGQVLQRALAAFGLLAKLHRIAEDYFENVALFLARNVVQLLPIGQIPLCIAEYRAVYFLCRCRRGGGGGRGGGLVRHYESDGEES